MPANVTVPSALHSVGMQTYGPVTLAVEDDTIEVRLDRTVNQGMNSKTSACTVQAVFRILLPGDPEWHLQSNTTFEGGIRIDQDTGQAQLRDSLSSGLIGAGVAGRQLRLELTVAGSSVRLTGSIIVS